MRNIYFYGIILIIFHFSFTASAQQTQLDSLYSVWKNPSQGDSMRIDAFYRYISEGFLNSQPDSALVLAKEMINFSKAKGYRNGEVDGLNMMGLIYDVKNNYAKALECLLSSLSIAEELNYQKGIATSLTTIGNIYYHQGYYPRALESYQRSLAIAEKLGNQEGIAAALNNIGIIYYEQADYPKALEYYYRCLKIGEKLKNPEYASTLTNIGAIHHLQGDYPKALEYYQRSLKIDEKVKNQVGIAIDLANIGENYAIQGNYSRAEEHYQRSLRILEEVGEQDGMISLLVNLGKIYFPQGDYPRALQFCKKGLELAVKIGTLEKQKSACQCLYDTYKTMNRGNEALIYLEKIRGIEDSLQEEETAKMLQQMEFQKLVLQDSIASAEEKRTVEEAHREEVRKKTRTKNILLASGILLLLTVGGLYSRVRFIRKSKAVLQAEKDRSENLLLNILPEEIAAELKEKGWAEPRNFDKVSILFSDFKSFTETSEQLSAVELVNEINHCFSAFDSIIEKQGIEKIKTIGDAYMAAGGLPLPSVDSVKNILLAALDMQEFITRRKAENEAQGKPAFEMRVGIHTGPVVAGIVGVKKFQYDIWGDTVNTASRMESNGEAGKVNISQATYEMMKDDPAFVFESRGIIDVKGKGKIQMWFTSKSKK